MTYGVIIANHIAIIILHKEISMIYLEINAEISRTKQFEFNQSKLSFIDKLHNLKGYSGFTEKLGDDFQIRISWLNKSCLDNFLKTEHYKVFHGAIVTLSSQNNINIITEDLKTK